MDLENKHDNAKKDRIVNGGEMEATYHTNLFFNYYYHYDCSLYSFRKNSC